MSKNSYVNANLISTYDTFANWLTKTNQIIYDMGTSVITTNSSATPDVTTGNGYVNGFFGSNTLYVYTALHGGTPTALANLNITSNLYISSNATVAANLLVIGTANVTVNLNSVGIVANNVSINNNLTVTNTATLNTATAITANITTANIVTLGVTGVGTAANLNVTNTANLNNANVVSANITTLGVTGLSTLVNVSIGTGTSNVQANTTQLTIANPSATASVNATSFSGTANNSTNFGGLSLATVQGHITGNASAAYTNATNFAFNFVTANNWTSSANVTFTGANPVFTGLLTANGGIYRLTGNGPAYWLQQDGTGRQSWYWNSSGGTSPLFSYANEDASALTISATSTGAGGSFFHRSADGTGKAAGASLTWTTTLYVDLNTITWKGSAVAVANGATYNLTALTANNSTNFGGLSLATVQGQITGNSANVVTYLTTNNYTVTGVVTHSANLIVNTANQLLIGNATVNAVANQTSFYVVNSTTSTTINPGVVTFSGGATINNTIYSGTANNANGLGGYLANTLSPSDGFVLAYNQAENRIKWTNPSGISTSLNTNSVIANASLQVGSNGTAYALTVAGNSTSTNTIIRSNNISLAVDSGNIQLNSNTLVSNSLLVSNTTANVVITTSQITVQNGSTSSVITQNSFSRQANGATFLGPEGSGVNLSTLQSQITSNASAAYTNATTFAANASNITTGTLSAGVLPSTVVNTSGAFTVTGVITHNANLVMNTANQLLLGNATVNAVANQTNFAIFNGSSNVIANATTVVVGGTATINSTAFSRQANGATNLGPEGSGVTLATLESRITANQTYLLTNTYTSNASVTWAAPNTQNFFGKVNINLVANSTFSPVNAFQFYVSNAQSGGYVWQVNKQRNATIATRYLFADVGGNSGDAQAGAFWRGFHIGAPTLTATGPGTISTTAGSNTVTGTSTLFSSGSGGNYVGTVLKYANGVTLGTVSTVASDTSLTIEGAGGASATYSGNYIFDNYPILGTYAETDSLTASTTRNFIFSTGNDITQVGDGANKTSYGMRFSTGGLGATRLQIASNGNIGIACTSPTRSLDVFGPSKFGGTTSANRKIEVSTDGLATFSYWNNALNSLISLENLDVNSTADHGSSILWRLSTNASSTAIDSGRIDVAKEQLWTSTASTQDSYMRFLTASDGTLAERIRLTSAGRFGIGTSNPQSPLQIGSTITPGTAEATHTGQIQINGGGDLASQAGIEFKSSISGSGYGWKIVSADRGSGNVPLALGFRNTSATWSELLTLRSDNNGRVGILTNNPNRALEVNGQQVRVLAGADDSGFEGYSAGVHIFSATRESNSLKLSAYDGVQLWSNCQTAADSGTERMRIVSNGHVGIGTTTPEHLLDVAGRARVQSGFQSLTRDDISVRTNSGYWQTNTPTFAEGWPSNDNATWHHMFCSTHTNDANYYSMQFAGNFNNSNDVYYRSVSSATTSGANNTNYPWRKLWHDGNDGSGSGLDSDLIKGTDGQTVIASLRANRAICGGGTITVDASTGNVKWSSRFIVISNGLNSNFSTNGYFDIICPDGVTAGQTSVTGVGGATNKTVTTAGIPLAAWEALYYILPIGNANTINYANFRVASYTSALDIPSNWVLICVRNGDNGIISFTNGINLFQGQSYNTVTQSSVTVNATSLGGVASSGYALLSGATFTGTVTVPSGFTISRQGGVEGGEFALQHPASGTTMAGTALFIDTNGNNLRIFENGGSFRGIGIDITTCESQSTFATTTTSQTFTTKRINPRISSAASGDISPDISAADMYVRTALAAATTINAPTGTPLNGNRLMFRLKDNGTARALNWNGTYRAVGVTLPTTTVLSKVTYVGAIYNSDETVWDVIAVSTQA